MLSVALRGRRAFTLVELLVVVLILAILMAVALPLYLDAVQQSEIRTCQANMQTIANAAQAYKVKDTNHTFGTLPVSGAAIGQRYTDLQATPTCPKGGTYTVAAEGTGIRISCSVEGHGSFVPGVGVSP